MKSRSRHNSTKKSFMIFFTMTLRPFIKYRALPQLKRDRIIAFSFIKQHIRRKLTHINVSNHKAKFITFYIWPRGTSENIFKDKSLAHLKVGGKCKKLVIVKLSLKQNVKYLKLTPNIKLSQGASLNLFTN